MMEAVFRPPTYSEVMSGKVQTQKLGKHVTVIQFVDSDTPDIPWEIKRIRFRTIGEREVKIPPSLPNGFKFMARLDWQELRREILATTGDLLPPIKYYHLDKVFLDLYRLDESLGQDYFGDGDSVFEDKEYSEWFSHFDDKWEEFDKALKDLQDFSLPHAPWNCSTKLIEEWQEERQIYGRDPLPNRFYPPSLRTALEMMLKYLPEFEQQHQKPDSN